MENKEFYSKNQNSIGKFYHRRPHWLKVPLPSGDRYLKLKSLVKSHYLNTVCESAFCPNIGTCWSQGTLTIMILGNICTRSCGFCSVNTGKPIPPDGNEPQKVAEFFSNINIKYAVITSVDRDDLKDGGSEHWAITLKAIRKKCPNLILEALIPDFRGDENLLGKICAIRPDVLSHNLETVASLQSRVRVQGRYDWSLKALKFARENFGLITKSGLMLGLGEKREEIIQTMADLVESGCQIMSIGQYMQPTRDHLPVVEYIHPDVFLEYEEIGKSLGFVDVMAGPLVRSSFQAEKQVKKFKF